ncbi:ATP-binding protein [Streptomyces solincola]|uniref:ATP-binding protein n=1 Tax=Streptomyces solincola TaxID=2100817 RepID=A0A2S9PYI6_9ACTN|nr:ATP-binding protein [Streptomyces solincola]PRH79484.1 ATP-binding protein [Streptomyces solincola]
MTVHTTALPAGAREILPDDTGLGSFAACALEGSPRSAGRARRFTEATLRDWALPAVSGDMELIVTELVANAVRHGLGPSAGPPTGYPVWLGLFRYPGAVVCAVADPSPEPPRPRATGCLDTGGRGLALVGAVSDEWSWDVSPVRGKTVWATLSLPGSGEAAP